MIKKLDVRTWGTRKIYYDPLKKVGGKGELVEVFSVPDTNEGVAMDAQGRFYVSNAKQNRWTRTEHGIFEVERMLWEMMLGYRIELPSIEALREEAQKLNIEFETLDIGDPDVQDRVREQIIAIAEPLAHVRSEPKKAARKQIVVCLLFRDKLGRLNIGVFRARTIAALNRLFDRIKEIKGIQRHIFMRLAGVQTIARCVTFVLNTAEENLGSAIRVLENGQREEAKDLLIMAGKDVRQLTVGPLLQTQALIIQPLREALKAMQGGNDAEATEKMRFALHALRLKRQRVRLEALLLQFVALRKKSEPTECLQPWFARITTMLMHVEGEENTSRTELLSSALKLWELRTTLKELDEVQKQLKKVAHAL
ncbi:MAG: hypothetical protein Q7S16_04855 [bacterium]|nr:hypothetical protein [bacterium]